jgi:hypothetical protein
MKIYKLKTKYMKKSIDFYIDENNCWICTSHQKTKPGYTRKEYNNINSMMHRYFPKSFTLLNTQFLCLFAAFESLFCLCVLIYYLQHLIYKCFVYVVSTYNVCYLLLSWLEVCWMLYTFRVVSGLFGCWMVGYGLL